ncbi:MAG: hypothetical protein SPF17_00630 [Candidatus Mucispirillum faecigallinarum]|nr:hypothetical protein [Candidatus Mucispirillum faecigallinarum]
MKVQITAAIISQARELAAVIIQIIQAAVIILAEIMILEQILKTQMMKVAIQ